MRRLFQFENRQDPLASQRRFTRRLVRNTLWSSGLVAVWLIIGMAGYMGFESMGLVDAFANAAMILSGMGPLQPLYTVGGKIFAGFYAIISGILIFGVAGIMLAPVFHRMMHRFHLQDGDDAGRNRRK